MSVSTPTRSFGRKQSPIPLPDAKSTYEPLLKRELASRLIPICVTSFAVTWLVSLASTINFSKGPPLGLLGHLVATGLMALSSLAVGGIPLLVLRGRTVSATYTPLPTPVETFVALVSNTQTWRMLAYFAASGFSLTLLHVAFLNLSEWEDSRLTILSPTRRNAFRLNERFFYLAFFNSSLGLVIASRDIIRHRWTTKWPHPNDERDTITILTPSSSVVETILAALNYKALLSTALTTLIHGSLFPISYHVFRAFALPFLRNIPALSWLTRPLLHGFGRTWVVDVSWSRVFALGFKTSLGWELVESTFDYWLTKPITTSPKAHDPNQAIVAGLHSRDAYVRHHAYLELSALATSPSTASSARRTALFTDTKTKPTLWDALLREVLMTLGRDYQLLLRRGKRSPPAPTPSRPTPSTPRTSTTPSTPLLRQAILKPSPRALFDSLASDGAVTQALTSVVSLPESVSIPSVFLPSEPSTPQIGKEVTTKKKETVKVVEVKTSVLRKLKARRNAVVIGVLGWGESKMPREWRVKEWWTSVSLEKRARACMPEGDLDVAAVEALSHLIAASLAEDALGNVQRHIPRALEALLSFLAEAEAYQAELESKLLPGDEAANADGHASEVRAEAAKAVAQAVEVVLPVITALRMGVGLITKTFGDRLSVYRFPPPTAKRLQSFMDYL